LPKPVAVELPFFVRDAANAAWVQPDGLDLNTREAMTSHITTLMTDDRYSNACARGKVEVKHPVPSCFTCVVILRNRNLCNFNMMALGTFLACNKCYNGGKHPC
jgi:hypothetical protein